MLSSGIHFLDFDNEKILNGKKIRACINCGKENISAEDMLNGDDCTFDIDFKFNEIDRVIELIPVKREPR